MNMYCLFNKCLASCVMAGHVNSFRYTREISSAPQVTVVHQKLSFTPVIGLDVSGLWNRCQAHRQQWRRWIFCRSRWQGKACSYRATQIEIPSVISSVFAMNVTCRAACDFIYCRPQSVARARTSSVVGMSSKRWLDRSDIYTSVWSLPE